MVEKRNNNDNYNDNHQGLLIAWILQTIQIIQSDFDLYSKIYSTALFVNYTKQWFSFKALTLMNIEFPQIVILFNKNSISNPFKITPKGMSFLEKANRLIDFFKPLIQIRPCVSKL